MTDVDDTARSRPWAVLATLGIGLFMTLLDTSIVSIALPEIIDDLGASLDEAVWVYSIYVLLYSVLLIMAGRLGDMLGPRRVYLAGLVVFTVASAACGLAQGATELIVARAVQGVGAALLAPQLLAIVSVVFSPSRWNAAFGATGALAGVAVLVGPTAGGLVVTSLGWQSIFLLNVPLGVIGVVLALRLVPDPRPGTRAPLHVGALVLGTAGLVGIFFGLLEGQRHDWSLGIWLAIGGGALSLVGFMLLQRRQADEDRLVPVMVFAERNFTAMTIVIGAMGFAMLGLFLPLTIHFQSVLGWSALKAGITIAAMPLAAIVTASLSSKLVERFTAPRVLAAGLFAFAAGMAGVVAAIGVDTPRLAYVPGLVLAGLGMGCVFAPLYSIAMGSVRTELSGLASGVLSTAQELGAVVAGATVGGVLLQSRLASAQADWAQREATKLPADVRERFIAAFHDAGGAATQVGVGQPGAAGGGLDPQLAAGEVARLAGVVFRNAFVDAIRPALVVPIAALVLVAAVCLVRTRSAQAPAGTAMDDPGAVAEDPGVATEEPGVATEEPGVAEEDPAAAMEDPGGTAEDPGAAMEDPRGAEAQGVAAEDPGATDEDVAAAGAEPESDPEPDPYEVLCTYLVKPDQVDAIRELLRRHWLVLRERGFVTDTPARIYFGEDGSGPFFVEILTWIDPRASSRAYYDEAVNAIWNDLYLFTESRDGRPAIEYPQVEVVELAAEPGEPPGADVAGKQPGGGDGEPAGGGDHGDTNTNANANGGGGEASRDVTGTAPGRDRIGSDGRIRL